MTRAVNGTYVCWRCLRHRPSSASFSGAGRRTGDVTLSRLALTRAFATVHHSDQPRSQKLETVPAPSAGVAAFGGDASPVSAPPIRERLAQWEAEHATLARVIPRDYAKEGVARNLFTRGESLTMVELESDPREERNLFDGDELVDLRSDTAKVEAGDLIEISSRSWRIQLLAVCLGRFNSCDHFYTQSGKWFTSHGVRTLFTVKNFVEPEELEPVVAALPSTDASPELLDVLQELKLGPTRDVAAGLILKMLDFVRASELIHQANVAKLDNAFDAVKAPGKYLTLHELAEALLPSNSKVHGRFKPAALYAVHKAVMNDDAAFRPMAPLAHKRSYLFEVSSAEDVDTVRRVESLLRSHYEKYAPGMPKHVDSPLDVFAKKARRLVDHSRRFRPWSPHGMLGPSSGTSKAWDTDWTKADMDIINFIHLWASIEKFSLSSRLHWIGAGILRTLERYDDSLYLTPSTGWTFLQEIGWTSPWDIQARYTMCLPEVHAKRNQGLQRPIPHSKGRSLREDICEGVRKDWGAVRAYCIDSASATDIDDAVSLERTEKPDEFFIHVHVADPASRLGRDSGTAAMAALVPQTVYLPGHFERMFADDAFREAFSLAPGQPCLTFTARVNLQGMVISSEITPGILRDVVYITPGTAAEVCGETKTLLDVGTASFAVGKPPEEEQQVNRPMAGPDELGNDDRETLRDLSRLAHALHAVRLANGAMPLFWPRPAAQVSFQHTAVTETQQGMVHCEGDPYIRISYDNSTSSSRLVESTMRLAGEIAAQWCHARGIPVPYRTQPQAERNLPQLRALTRDVLYPQLLHGSRPSDAQRRALSDLLGADDVSSAPGPHFLMGVSMYTKATSPLRRYADLLVHWQIHAAMARERALGRRLTAEDADAAGEGGWLPFSRRQLDHEVLPLLRVRERALKALDSVEGNAQWMLQALVRAWRFGEAELPATFAFTVTGVLAGRAVRGRLDWFERPALLEAGMLGPETGVTMAEVREGDVFEVELEDVNVHSREIRVKALRRAEATKTVGPIAAV